MGSGLSVGCSWDKPVPGTASGDHCPQQALPEGISMPFGAESAISPFLGIAHGLNVPCGVLCSSSRAMVSLALRTKWCSLAAIISSFSLYLWGLQEPIACCSAGVWATLHPALHRVIPALVRSSVPLDLGQEGCVHSVSRWWEDGPRSGEVWVPSP